MTILDSIRRLVGAPAAAARSSDDSIGAGDVRLAACVMLLELANVDGEFSDIERLRIGELLQRHFGVDADGANQLIQEATRISRDSVDDFVFTRQVVRDYTLAQRMVLAELMWQVVLADGELHERESYLMRKLANLLQLEPAFLAEARKRSGGATT